MKKRKDALWAILLGVILPVSLLHFPPTQQKAIVNFSMAAVLTEERIIEMDIEKYLVGVLLCEMPADFEVEALKAQAVAARTFVLHRKESNNKHPDADVCASPACCQGYIDPENYISNGGDASTVLKMYDAVAETKGEVLLYDGEFIEATYFSSSGGRTEDAQAVWGVEVPYLISVDSAEADDPYIRQMSKEMFCKALGMTGRDVYIDAPTYTQGGGIAEIEINGKLFTGVQLRKFLGLRSTQISFSVENESVEIITKGHGHRVGMSQYGADAMAECGSNYIEILTHYYSGVTIQPYVLNNN